MATNLDELCEAVLSARSAKDKLKAELDACGKTLQAAEDKLSAALSDEKVSHGGLTFSTTVFVSWKTPKDGKDKLLALLKEGAPELVKESVNSSTLSAYLRKNATQLDTDAPDWWTKAKSYVERHETTKLSVKRSKTNRATLLVFK